MLIELDAAIKQCERHSDYTAWSIKDGIEALPTIDPESLRPTGEWIFKHNPITDPKGYFIRIVCSECNLHTGQKSNYCPNCGARMKEAT